MTDTTTRPARPQHTAAWPQRSSLRTAVELLLGLSFVVTVAFGGYGAAVQRTSIVAELGAVVFVAALMCVLVSWFTGAGETAEDDTTR